MGISVGKHVDAHGRIYLPYLQNWSHVRGGVTDGRNILEKKACLDKSERVWGFLFFAFFVNLKYAMIL